MLWGQPEDAITARTHMLLRVEAEGKSWLADCGFGGNTPTGPLQLVADVEQATPHESFRLIRRDDGDWRQSTFSGADCTKRLACQHALPLTRWKPSPAGTHLNRLSSAVWKPSGMQHVPLPSRSFSEMESS